MLQQAATANFLKSFGFHSCKVDFFDCDERFVTC